MKNVVGIFERRSDAERAVDRLVALGLTRENVSLLAPGDGDAPTSVKTTDTEPSSLLIGCRPSDIGRRIPADRTRPGQSR